MRELNFSHLCEEWRRLGLSLLETLSNFNRTLLLTFKWSRKPVVGFLSLLVVKPKLVKKITPEKYERYSVDDEYLYKDLNKFM